MKAITIDDLAEWLDEQANWDVHRHEPVDPSDPYAGPVFEAYVADQERKEKEYVATLTASQHLDYLVFQGVLGEECPQCHTRLVEVTNWEYPDMIGETVGETWECCGYSTNFNTALEYDHNGKMVDVR
jgi:hypothetical protein